LRGIGVLGTLAALVAFSAEAMDGDSSCAGLLDEDDETEAPLQLSQPLLTENQCEALKNRELRAPLLQIPQEGEDPMELSLGVKDSSGTLRFKVPFSF